MDMSQKHLTRLNKKPSPSAVLLAALVILSSLAACRTTQQPPTPQHIILPPLSTAAGSSSASTPIKIKAEVWADNWFAFYLGTQLVKEDSVSIQTERSFNAEVFTFDATYPLQLNFIAKDYIQNDTGLEYIGTNRQQMGDGGFIAQFTDANSGKLIAATDTAWACTVIHEAPLDKACATQTNPIAGQGPCGFKSLPEPAHWKEVGFDASAWPKAIAYTKEQVGAKEGYDLIQWQAAAKLIWGPDLQTNNTLLCRLTVQNPTPASSSSVIYAPALTQKHAAAIASSPKP